MVDGSLRLSVSDLFDGLNLDVEPTKVQIIATHNDPAKSPLAQIKPDDVLCLDGIYAFAGVANENGIISEPGDAIIPTFSKCFEPTGYSCLEAPSGALPPPPSPSPPTPVPPSPCPVYADANGDSVADVLDAITIINEIQGKQSPTGCTDVNSDGSVDVLDAIEVILVITGGIGVP